MIHPIFMTVLRRPELLIAHLANYAALVKGELSSTVSSLAIRAAGAAVALIALVLALGLTGVALMLGYMEGSFHWVLAAVPAAAWLLTLIGALVASHSTLKEKVEDVKEELDTDLKLLRLSKAAIHD